MTGSLVTLYTTWPGCTCYIFTFLFFTFLATKYIFHMAWMHLLNLNFYIFTFFIKKIYILPGLGALVIFSLFHLKKFTTWPGCTCYIFTFSSKKYIYHLARMNLLYFHFFYIFRSQGNDKDQSQIHLRLTLKKLLK